MVEQNKRLANIYSAFHLSFDGTDSLPLRIEDYFPFDPYHLKLSRHFIDPIYNEWVPPAPPDGLSDNASSDSGTDLP